MLAVDVTRSCSVNAGPESSIDRIFLALQEFLKTKVLAAILSRVSSMNSEWPRCCTV